MIKKKKKHKNLLKIFYVSYVNVKKIIVRKSPSRECGTFQVFSRNLWVNTPIYNSSIYIILYSTLYYINIPFNTDDKKKVNDMKTL